MNRGHLWWAVGLGVMACSSSGSTPGTSGPSAPGTSLDAGTFPAGGDASSGIDGGAPSGSDGGGDGAVSDAPESASDVVIYGGTSAGVMAAVQASRQGKTVTLLEPGRHLGGMSAGGLSFTDKGNEAAIGGLALEFYRTIGASYGTTAPTFVFEPHVAEAAFEALVASTPITVVRGVTLASVDKAATLLLVLRTVQGRSFAGKVFIDASYEGDLLAAAQVKYAVGREANGIYGESANGVTDATVNHDFLVPVDPYVTAGNASSGLLPFVAPGQLAPAGSGDGKVQAYDYRLCLTRDPANQLPIDAPGYDETQYELLARYVEARVARGDSLSLADFMVLNALPNGKTDIDSNGGFSTDAIGLSTAYPEADAAGRATIVKAHETYTRGLLHFLATSTRVPQALRAAMGAYGLCKDEFTDTAGWPHQLYVREARRMVGAYVMTEHDVLGTTSVPDSVGLGSSPMDVHNAQRIVVGGGARDEGNVQRPVSSPYPVAYRSLTPSAADAENLLVPVCLSASHAAYGSVRMEPVYMILGQAAGAAASLAIDSFSNVQQVDPAALQAQLTASHAILRYP